MLRKAGATVAGRLCLGQHMASGAPLLLAGERRGLAAPGGSDAQQRMEQAAAQGDLQGVLGVVESAGEGFDSSEAVAAALQQVELCVGRAASEDVKQKLHSNKTFQMLCDMAVSTAGRAPPEALARMIGCLGRLSFSDELVLDELARHLMPGVGRLQPRAMEELVEGLRRADHSPSVVLLDAVHARMSELQQEQGLPAQRAEAVGDGLRELGRDDGNAPNTSADAAQPERIKYT